MEQGLKLLIQLVIEFAPVVVNLIQKRAEESLDTTKYPIPQAIQAFVEIAHTLKPKEDTGFEQEKLLQKQLAAYHRETQLEVAKKQRDTALKLPEVHKILDNWPLRLYPAQILESHLDYGRTPLKIFIAPPQVKFDEFEHNTDETADIETMLAEGLREFINKNYSLHHPIRPTEFLAGAWDSKRFHSESSIKALFGTLKTEPVLILESEKDGDYLNFRIAYWGLGQANYYYKTITRIPYKEIIQQSARNRALEWRKVRDELLNLGEDIAEINQFGKDNVVNLAILEKAEKWQSQGIDIGKLGFKYQVNHQDFEALCQVLITCHSLVTAWVADIYHLVHHDVAPLLPELLPNLLQDACDMQSIQAIATGYQQVYQALEKERVYWIPELALQLAHSLAHLPDRTWSQTQVDYSILTWLDLHQVSVTEFAHPLEAMQSAIRIEDEDYIQKLKEYFLTINDQQNLIEVEKLLTAIAHLKLKRTFTTPDQSYTLTGNLGKVTSVAINPEGELLISGCTEQNVNIWDLHKGNFIKTMAGNLGEVSSVAISPNGDLLAVGSCEHPRSNVKVWNLKTGQLLHTLLGHQKPVNVVVISPDGQILASGSNKIKIWNLHKGDRICTLWHSSAVHAIAISPDGTILASGSSDTKIRLWNPQTGDPLRTFVGHTGDVKSITMSPDGQLLFSGSSDTTIKIWHLLTGKLLYTLTGHTAAITSLAISHDGQTLFSSSVDTTIKIWRIPTCETIQTLTGHSQTVNTIALSPDGKMLASGSADQTIKIWQIDQIS